MRTEPLELLPWDSAHFGFGVARVAAGQLDATKLDAALRNAERQDVRCVYLLVSADDAEASQLAQGRGFLLRDVRVELERSVLVADAATTDASAIGEAAGGQRAALEALARRRFTDSRFFADPGFPREACEALYVAFLRRGLETPERRTLATPDASGFVVCHFDRDRDTGTIDLIAVSEQAAGAGLGSALVTAALRAFAEAGLERAEVVTQAANIGAQRLYQRSGFRTQRVGLWFHRWLG